MILLVASLMLDIRLIARAQSSTVENADTYLTATQNADGSWGHTATSLNGDFPTTAAVAIALRTAEGADPTVLDKAIAYLTAQPVDVTPYLAARVLALQGQDADTTADVQTLLARQNEDGGWGTLDGYGSDVLDTALALQALGAAGVVDPAVVGRGLNSFAAAQGRDGGWPLVQGEDSQVYYTAQALFALDAFRLRYVTSTNRNRALSYLHGQQHPGGGYGVGDGTPFETALALLAVYAPVCPLPMSRRTRPPIWPAARPATAVGPVIPTPRPWPCRPWPTPSIATATA